MSPELVEALTGHRFPMVSATLNGFERLCVDERSNYHPYPAIVPKKDSTVNGMLLRYVDQGSQALFDLFEGGEYEVKVDTAHGSVSALTYVWAGKRDRLGGSWSFTDFEKNSVAHYINSVIPDLA